MENSKKALGEGSVHHGNVPSFTWIGFAPSKPGYRYFVPKKRLARLPGVSHRVPRGDGHFVPEPRTDQIPFGRVIADISLPIKASVNIMIDPSLILFLYNYVFTRCWIRIILESIEKLDRELFLFLFNILNCGAFIVLLLYNFCIIIRTILKC